MRMLDRTLKKPFFPAPPEKKGDTPVKLASRLREVQNKGEKEGDRIKGEDEDEEVEEDEWVLVTKWLPGDEEEESFSVKKGDEMGMEDKNSLFFEPEEFASTDASPSKKGTKEKKRARKGMGPGDSLYMFKVRYSRFAYELYPSIVRNLHINNPPHPSVTYKNIMSFIKGSWESVQVPLL